MRTASLSNSGLAQIFENGPGRTSASGSGRLAGLTRLGVVGGLERALAFRTNDRYLTRFDRSHDVSADPRTFFRHDRLAALRGEDGTLLRPAYQHTREPGQFAGPARRGIGARRRPPRRAEQRPRQDRVHPFLNGSRLPGRRTSRRGRDLPGGSPGSPPRSPDMHCDIRQTAFPPRPRSAIRGVRQHEPSESRLASLDRSCDAVANAPACSNLHSRQAEGEQSGDRPGGKSRVHATSALSPPGSKRVPWSRNPNALPAQRTPGCETPRRRKEPKSAGPRRPIPR